MIVENHLFNSRYSISHYNRRSKQLIGFLLICSKGEPNRKGWRKKGMLIWAEPVSLGSCSGSQWYSLHSFLILGLLQNLWVTVVKKLSPSSQTRIRHKPFTSFSIYSDSVGLPVDFLAEGIFLKCSFWMNSEGISKTRAKEMVSSKLIGHHRITTLMAPYSHRKKGY